MSAKFKTKFNINWLSEPLFASWLQQVKDNCHEARCILCKKNFQLSNMGRQAVVSHQHSQQHMKIAKATSTQPALHSVLPNPQTPLNVSTEAGVVHVVSLQSEPELQSATITTADDSAAIVPAAQPITNAAPKQKSLTGYAYNDAVTKSEILWALHVIAKHQSYRSCDNLKELFIAMFPDSSIAQKFTLGAAKIAYCVVYGLAPYFKSELTDLVSECEFYVVCFDEALNQVAQRGQMDIVVRFWDSSTNAVNTRYLSSVFHGHATAAVLEQMLKEGLAPLSEKKVIQVSMDGPNVNLKLLESLRNSRDEGDRKLLEIGTCGLHVLHGAFQTGHSASGWAVNEFLRSAYGLFKDSPARRADYASVTGSSVYPKKFCQVRWLNNVEVATRALEVLPNIKKYISEKSGSLPKNITCQHIKEACNDPLIRAKTHFFISVAAVVEPFLRKYQTNKPMVPFMYQDMGGCLRNLMARFMKKEVLAEADTVTKLCKLDVKDSKFFVAHKDVDIGVAAKTELSKCKLSERDIMQFRMECRTFLSAMTAKILERSPLKYTLVRSASSLVPTAVLHGTSSAKHNFTTLVEKLFESNNISAAVADSAKNQYSLLCQSASTDRKLSFESYSPSTSLDTFYFQQLGCNSEYKELWHVVKMVLVMSHGNAAVESGFSVNEGMLVENLHEDSLVGQRVVYDAILNAGGVMAVNINKRMLQYVRSARSRWEEALKVKREQSKEKDLSSQKRLASEIQNLEAKKAKLVSDAANAVSNIEMELSQLKSLCSNK
jgi:hypothetical protein